MIAIAMGIDKKINNVIFQSIMIKRITEPAIATSPEINVTEVIGYEHFYNIRTWVIRLIIAPVSC